MNLQPAVYKTAALPLSYASFTNDPAELLFYPLSLVPSSVPGVFLWRYVPSVFDACLSQVRLVTLVVAFPHLRRRVPYDLYGGSGSTPAGRRFVATQWRRSRNRPPLSPRSSPYRMLCGNRVTAPTFHQLHRRTGTLRGERLSLSPKKPTGRETATKPGSKKRAWIDGELHAVTLLQTLYQCGERSGRCLRQDIHTGLGHSRTHLNVRRPPICRG